MYRAKHYGILFVFLIIDLISTLLEYVSTSLTIVLFLFCLILGRGYIILSFFKSFWLVYIGVVHL